MQERTTINTEDELVETAARWFARLRSCDISEQEQREFSQWLAADKAHQKAFSDIAEVWEEAGKLLALPEETSLPRKSFWFFPPMSLSSFLGWGTGAVAVTAMILMVFFRAPLQEMWHQYQGEEINFITMNGEHRKIHLSDGSIMEMNADTRLTCHICARQRTVSLKKGEVFFQVVPNRELPFRVHTKAGVITVLGTRFNVKAAKDEIAVDVDQGRVQVKTLPQPNSRHMERAIIITRGQGVDYTTRGNLKKVRQANAEIVQAWRNNRICFNENSLEQVAEMIQQQCNIRVFFPPVMRQTETFTGTFDRNQPEEILTAIKIAFSLDLKIHQDYAQFTIP